MKVVKKAIKVRIYPTKVDRNDDGEKKANIGKIESISVFTVSSMMKH